MCPATIVTEFRGQGLTVLGTDRHALAAYITTADDEFTYPPEGAPPAAGPG
ncbi:hypothetical protein [Nocardia donostiensis]|uniref:hypothetical protein n=1 Tax=Nocardia donostiensis TaxID=1538463 RepID=UPI00158B38E2|nr:hypothetical protein [Nocardia donostiensis]